MRPIRTLNKRRRRAEKRAMYDMYIAIHTRRIDQGGGIFIEIGNEVWDWRTKRSYRSRRPRPQGIFETIEAIHAVQTSINNYVEDVYEHMLSAVGEGPASLRNPSPSERS